MNASTIERPVIDIAQAARFLDMLAEGEPVTFQTFDESPRKRPELAQYMHGAIESCAPALQALNRRGAGIFWMVNYGDGKGRSGENATGIRALFLDLDGAPLQAVLAAGVEPHAVVESSPGKWHVYWLVTGCSLQQFTPAQKALAAKFNGDKTVHDLPRVLRVPGFLHRKGEPFLTRIASLEPLQPYQFDVLVQRLGLDLSAPALAAPRVDASTGEIVGKVTAGGRHEHLRRKLSDMNWRGIPEAGIRAALHQINATDCDPPKPAAEVDALVTDWLKRYPGQHGRDLQREQQRKRAQDIGDGASGQAPLTDVMSLSEMVEHIVFISDGSRVAYRDRPQTALPLSEFKLHMRASETRVGKKHMPTADLWVQDPQRITTHTITYRPGHPEFTTDPEGNAALNLWRKRHRPTASASVDLFLHHVAYLVPDDGERERFLNWLAHIEQQPGVLPHTHYLMVAQQTGIGRNWLASLLARVWAGATRLGFDLVGAMHTGFNGALSRRLLVIVDELKAADGGYGAANHAEQLKAMLTTEHRGINPKFGRQHIEFNCARWLMLSQHYDALPLARTDRRVIVITNPTERRSSDYYAQAYARLDDQAFIDAVGGWLASRDIRGFNPSEPAPLTASKAKAIEACISDIERALIELRDGTDAVVLTNSQINEYMQDCGLRVPAGRAMSVAYAAAGLVPCDRLVTILGKKHRVVALRDGNRIKGADTVTLIDLLGQR